MKKEHGLYKYVYDGEIIYIGKSNSSIYQRINNHARESKFLPYIEKSQIYVCMLRNSTETDVCEKLLINKYRPILNVVDKHDLFSSLQFNEPGWISYSEYLSKRPKEQIARSEIDKEERRRRRAEKKRREQRIWNIFREAHSYLECELICNVLKIIDAMRKSKETEKWLRLEYPASVWEEALSFLSRGHNLADWNSSSRDPDLYGYVNLVLNSDFGKEETKKLKELLKEFDVNFIKKYKYCLIPNYEDGELILKCIQKYKDSFRDRPDGGLIVNYKRFVDLT